MTDYKKYDGPGKAAVRRYLDKLGYFTNAHESRDVDLTSLTPDDFEPLNHEVEVKAVWEGEWPEDWKDVRIPKRKGRYTKRSVPVLFWVLRSDLRMTILIKGSDICDEQIKEVSNSRVRSGEEFYCVPIELCKFVDLEAPVGD